MQLPKLKTFPTWIIITILGVLAHAIYFIGNPILSFLTILFYIFAPGYLIMRIIGIREDSKWTGASYSLGLSLLFLILVGLILNSIHIFGIEKPLSTFNIFLLLDMAIVVLLVLARKNKTTFSHLSISKEQLAIGAIGISLPILTTAGAIRLNNDASNFLTPIAYTLIPILVVYLFVRYKNLKNIVPLIFFTIGLSLLLSVSLRGTGIIGHDIVREFYVFQLTSQAEFWTIDVFKNTYNACLSITILPTIFLKISHISDVFIFKFVFQFIFAFMLVPLFLFIKKYIGGKYACLAVLIFVSFPVFANDMPFLNRQEIAIFFFSLILLVLANARTQTTKHLVMALLFTIGMILSHYSSSYVAIALAALTWIIYFTRGHNSFKLRDRTLYVSLGLIVLSLFFAFTWNTQITQTSEGLASTIGKSLEDVKGLGDRSTSAQIKTQSQELSIAAGEFSSNTEYIQKEPNESNIPYIGSLLREIYLFVDNKKSLVILFFVSAALVWQIIKRRFVFTVQMSVTLAALIIIGVQILIPNLAIDYGAERLFQQLLILLIAPFLATMILIFRKFRIEKLLIPTMIIYFYALTGLLPQLTGAYYSKLAFSNAGQTYDIYYQRAGEQMSLKWLEKQNSGIPLTSFDYSGLYKLRLYDQSVFRRTVPPYGENGRDFLYKSSFNIKSGEYIYRGDTSNIYYKVKNPPLQNTIYSNSDSQIDGPIPK